MALTTIPARFAATRDPAATWTANNPILALGEFGFETDTGKLKVGNGLSAWNALAYFTGITDPEVVRDVIGAALTAGAGISITVDDAGDTISIAIDGAVIDERARDAVGAALVASTGAAVDVDDTGNSITLRAGAGLAFSVPSGSLYLSAVNATALSTIATVANLVYFWPVLPCAEDRSIASLVCRTTTGVAGAKIRLGLYSDNGGSPDALLAGGTELDCATSNTTQTDTAGFPYTLLKGRRYWLAAISNNTQTMRSIVTSACPIIGISDLSSTSPANCREVAQTYGALPSTAPATTPSSRTAIAIGMKAS